jgi:hypothetical protein
MKIAFILFLIISALNSSAQTGSQPASTNSNEEKEKKAIIESLTAETENFYKSDYGGVIKYYVHIANLISFRDY